MAWTLTALYFSYFLQKHIPKTLLPRCAPNSSTRQRTKFDVQWMSWRYVSIHSSVLPSFQQFKNIVDTWSATHPDWINKRRVHAVEWPYLQFRDYPPSTWYSHLCHDFHSLWCLPCIYRQEWYHQVFWAQHEQPHRMARVIVTRGHQRAEFQSRRSTLCDRQRRFKCADMVICRKSSGERVNWYVSETHVYKGAIPTSIHRSRLGCEMCRMASY